jgi:hypothetical protein
MKAKALAHCKVQESATSPTPPKRWRENEELMALQQSL